MIDPSRFGTRLGALAIYGLGRPPAEGLSIARYLADHEEWTKSPGEWFALCAYLHQSGGIRKKVHALVQSTVSRALPGALVAESAAVWFPHFIQYLSVARRRAVDLFWLWQSMIGSVGPGHSALVADVVELFQRGNQEPRDSQVERGLQPLLHWLFTHGSAELRSNRRAQLLERVLMTGNTLEAALSGLAVRFALRSHGRVQFWRNAEDDGAWMVFERALTESEPESLVVDAVCAASADGVYNFVPLATSSRFPRARDALLRGLASGLFPAEAALAGWREVLLHPFPVEVGLSLSSCDAMKLGFDALVERAHDTRRRICDGWTEFLVTEGLRFHEVPSGGCSSAAFIAKLELLAGWPSLAAEIGSAVRAAISKSRSQKPFALSRSLLEETTGRQTANVAAAIRALPVNQVPDAPPLTQPDAFDDIVSHLESVIRRPWPQPVSGVFVEHLLGSAARLVVRTLEGEDKVRVVGDALVVHEPVARTWFHGVSDVDIAKARATLYVLHELVHCAQGVGDKDVVSVLRATGAETSLMHLDVAADHAAALIAARAVPRWSVPWLKDVQTRALASFPTGPAHTRAARARKATRLVCVRADVLIRSRPGPLQQGLGDSYVFVDFGPGGGHIVVFSSGPPVAVIGHAPLTAEEARILDDCADPGSAGDAGIARLDSVLARAIVACTR